MIFKNKISGCRHDDEVPFKFMFGTTTANGCSHYDKGKCLMDNKKCKVVTYVKVKK